MSAGPVVLPRGFYRRDAADVAAELLNKVLVVGSRSGRIVEVEAYRGFDDPGSHSYRGRTARNASMFGPPGCLYVYRSYGLHWCANVVCEEEGVPHAVLIRALLPVAGVEAMRLARGGAMAPTAPSRQMGVTGAAVAVGVVRAVIDRDLCRGPGRLCQALGITGELDGADLVTGSSGIEVVDDGWAPPDTPGVSVRVGLTKGADHLSRYFVRGSRYLSRPG